MYQIEGLKLTCCMGSLEMCEENDASRILKEAEDLSCQKGLSRGLAQQKR